MNKTVNKNVVKKDKPLALSDESRIKVLSPGMLVLRRFIRNKLAIAGLVILVAMFLFSFVGAIFAPYDEAEMFKTYEVIKAEYASAQYNTEYRYTVASDAHLPSSASAQIALALSKGNEEFSVDGENYALENRGEGFYVVTKFETAANVMAVKGLYTINPVEGVTLPDGIDAALAASQDAGEATFEYEGDLWLYQKVGKFYTLSRAMDVALASMNVLDFATPEAQSSVDPFTFNLDAQTAVGEGAASFVSADAEYTVDYQETNSVISKDGVVFASIPTEDIIVNPLDSSNFLSLEFKEATRSAIIGKEAGFSYTGEENMELDYELRLVNAVYFVHGDAVSQIIDMYSAPSPEHWLGTDQNGMDCLTRLMYGGRVSLMVGFVVIIIETFIGVILGGISGYFGGWVDTCIMRFVDLFNCIPFWPMMIIVGSILDAYQVDPNIRIYLLMLVLGLMSWTSIARVVRGQILSLREQDFMVATEATGIRVSRRIFRHLVPNVMPLLIVNATMGLGSVIISEATLSFLGLGVKYPLASWGSIINSATSQYIMSNFWFMWIPAGLCILLTVLGFNFIGDGLRDAFDPKMKR